MTYILGSMLLVSLVSSFTAIMRWMRWKALAEMQAKELERLKNVTKLHCEQIDTLQKEKKGWHNKNKLLNDTNDKLTELNSKLISRNRDLSTVIQNMKTDVHDASERIITGIDCAKAVFEQRHDDFDAQRSAILSLLEKGNQT